MGVLNLGKVKSDFFVVFDRGECQLPDALNRIKKYCSKPKLSNFKILKIQIITVRARTLNAISQNGQFWNFYIYLLLHF